MNRTGLIGLALQQEIRILFKKLSIILGVLAAGTVVFGSVAGLVIVFNTGGLYAGEIRHLTITSGGHGLPSLSGTELLAGYPDR